MIRSRKSKREPSLHYSVKRRKLKRTSLDVIQKLIESAKGEAIQALHMVYDSDSISFETLNHTTLQGTFVSFLNLEGYTFIGYGSSKIASRSSASKIALLFLLEDLRSSCPSQVPDFTPLTQVLAVDTAEKEKQNDLPDMLASLVLSKYKQIKGDVKHDIPWFKMIAGIVMLHKNDLKCAEVVALTTGSKCIEPKNIQLDGSVIVDSHAEILVRRAFQYYLYSQLRIIDEDNSIFQITGTKYALKPDICFYMFISSAPCGDSRIFSLSNKTCTTDEHPNRLSRGVLRMKLDGGNSTVPINFEKYHNERLIIMSCSDKLLKINAIGVQGALLSNLLHPIYLSGIIIGDSFHQSHVSRALYHRAGEKVDFNPPFRLHNVCIYGLTKPIEIASKSPKTSVNWVSGYSIEVLNSTTGKTTSNQMSRLCKRSLLQIFICLKRYQEIEKIHTYRYFKNESDDYQNAKTLFFQVLKNKNLGTWIRRNPSFDEFTV